MSFSLTHPYTPGSTLSHFHCDPSSSFLALIPQTIDKTKETRCPPNALARISIDRRHFWVFAHVSYIYPTLLNIHPHKHTHPRSTQNNTLDSILTHPITRTSPQHDLIICNYVEPIDIIDNPSSSLFPWLFLSFSSWSNSSFLSYPLLSSVSKTGQTLPMIHLPSHPHPPSDKLPKSQQSASASPQRVSIVARKR